MWGNGCLVKTQKIKFLELHSQVCPNSEKYVDDVIGAQMGIVGKLEIVERGYGVFWAPNTAPRGPKCVLTEQSAP